MELYEKFKSNQNKGMLWNLLCNDGIFNAIPDNKADLVKTDFDRKIETIAGQITSTDTIIKLDKQVISEMLASLGKYAQKEEPSYSAANIAQKRQKIFETELTTKKKEFEAYNAVPVPDKIDFSDNLDSPIGSEMDKMLAEQIELREKQLNMVLKTQDKSAAAKWIQNPSEVKNEQIKMEPIKLKIGESVSMDIKTPTPKKVNFADTTENDMFLSLLKKKESPVTTTDSMLREILDKQNQILELLKLKN